jgi:hypothetical protein
LNDKIGPAIDVLLARMKPGVCWKRTNWSLSRTNERNQYPDRGVSRLTADSTVHDMWLRIEHQALASLPESRGVLFGIRLQHVPFSEVLQDPVAAQRLRGAIETMPTDVQQYLNQGPVRDRLLAVLAGESMASL